MGNCIRRQAVHPAGSLVPANSHGFNLFVSHNALFLRPVGTKGVDIRIGYKSLNLLSWLNALQQAKQHIGDGRIVSLLFNALLQVPSIADMRDLLPAARHVRSLDIYPGNTSASIAEWENYSTLAQFAESSFDDLQELTAIVPKDFDWTLLDKDAFQNLRKLEIRPIGGDYVPMLSANRRMLESWVLGFCADPHIFYSGEQVTARFLGWDFGTFFVRRLIQAIKQSQVNISVEVQVRDKAVVPITIGFVRSKKIRGRRMQKSGGTYSVRLSGDIVKITRVRGW